MAEIGINIEKAKDLLNKGHIVGIPTETVYGLAGNALEEAAILKIYKAKNRPSFDPLIAHTNTIEKVKGFVKEIPEEATKLASHFWPGPLTILLEKNKNVPDILTSGQSRVAIRIPNHSITRQLLSELDFPLAAPSANPFGYVSPTTAQHVQDQLGDRISYILDGGACKIGLESTIVGFEDDELIVYRLGGTKVEEIEGVIGSVKVQLNESSNPAAPGMLKSHYSPGRKLIVGDITQNLKRFESASTGVISFKKGYAVPVENQVILSSQGSLEEAASNIFSALRKMDQTHIQVILAEYLPNEGLGMAINDRLRRASV